jgi:hemoglobin
MKLNQSLIKPIVYVFTVAGLATLLSACFTGNNKNTVTMTDGQIPTPANYRGWNNFVPTVYKAKTGQIRELYINHIGMKANRGEDFPNGTVMVMELYSSHMENNQPVKDDLSKIFIMKKGANWGAAQPTGTIDNGDWVYAAYNSDGRTPATKDFSACRSCHEPLKDDDYIARYDEHFDTK